MSKLIKADFKNWLVPLEPNQELDINYNGVVGQAVDKLGIGGVVGVINARGPDNKFKLRPDDRFEKFLAMGERYSSISKLGGDGRVFRDNNSGIYFVKGQEMNFPISNGGKLTYLVYNVPLNKNFNEKSHEALKDPNTISILNLPSCKLLKGEEDFKYFDGVVIYASTAVILPFANKKSEEVYNKYIEGNQFGDFKIPNHKIGALGVSGGHEFKSLGSSYTEAPEFKGNTQDEFFNWLRTSIQNSTPKDLHKGSCAIETLAWGISRMKRKFFG